MVGAMGRLNFGRKGHSQMGIGPSDVNSTLAKNGHHWGVGRPRRDRQFEDEDGVQPVFVGRHCCAIDPNWPAHIAVAHRDYR